MSTYLQLFQDAKRECRIAGTEPTSVLNNSGVLDRLAHWIADSYTEIQNRRNWRWLRHSFTLPLVASTGAYAYGDCTDDETAAAITRFSHWYVDDLQDPPKAYLTSAGVGGEYWITYHPWEHFKTVYRRNLQPESNPAVCAVDHLERINIGPIPNDAYTFSGDYQLSPQILTSDSDVLEMPSRYQMVVVYVAMQKYGLTEGASEIMMRGVAEGNKLLRQLEINQSQRVRLGAPMA